MAEEDPIAREFLGAMGILAEPGPHRDRVMDRVFPLVYDQLRRLAEQQFAREAPGHTLQATALVHEAWLRLCSQSGQRWSEPGYFFGAAAEAMRRILIEHARRKGRPVRGAGWGRIPLDAVDVGAPPRDADWEAFDEALGALAAIDARAAQVVRLRVYSGLDLRGAAGALGVSLATVKREWTYARAWLRDRIDGP